MFTGIVQGMAEVVEIIKKKNFRTHKVRLDSSFGADFKPGASVAHNGCCLTISTIENDLISFDLMQETLKVTNLGLLNAGDRVNIERAARFGDEIGGHQMSGHILTTAKVDKILRSENNCQIWYKLADKFSKYLFSKGYVGIDGVSLTIGEINENLFNVNLIPETLQRTNIGTRQVGDLVNIEIDPQTQAIVDTVERLLDEKGFTLSE
jgi:riboflavin synthase